MLIGGSKDGAKNQSPQAHAYRRPTLGAPDLHNNRVSFLNISIAKSIVRCKPTTLRVYRGFPQRLYHRTPDWVGEDALFHIRIALDRAVRQQTLIVPQLASIILDSARFY